MARQEVNIGVEGNDGTGDSIRESFRKTNENFSELYAVFGQGGTINFTALADTPNQLTANTVPWENTHSLIGLVVVRIVNVWVLPLILKILLRSPSRTMLAAMTISTRITIPVYEPW